MLDEDVALWESCEDELLLEEAFRLAFADFESLAEKLLFEAAFRLALAEFVSVAARLLFAEAVKLAVRLLASVEPVVDVPDEFDVELVPEPPLAAARL